MFHIDSIEHMRVVDGDVETAVNQSSLNDRTNVHVVMSLPSLLYAHRHSL